MNDNLDGRRPSTVRDVRVAVIGAGLMGHSIAGVFAAAGASVSLYDPFPSALEAAPARIRLQLEAVGKDPEIADVIALTGELETAVAGADLVVEAVPENLELKQNLLAQLAQLLPTAVLATNSSVYRVGELASRVSNPERVVGTHWFNPPHLVPLVEVIQGEATAPEVVAWVIDFHRQAGKAPVHVRKDVPGFIGNRLQHALWREAIALVEGGVCDAETVDLVVRNSFGLRLAAMGPIENADYVGLDLTAAVHEYVFPSLSTMQQPAELVRDLVAKGDLGAKTGSGLLKWDSGRRETAAKRLEAHLLEQLRVGAPGRVDLAEQADTAPAGSGLAPPMTGEHVT
jgi:3-hydroxybutyryl-CoA dehydrogenase